MKFFEKHLSRPPQGWVGEFDPYNHNISGLPYPGQILRELSGWMHAFQTEGLGGTYNILDDARGAMSDLISADDIGNFIDAIWGH